MPTLLDRLAVIDKPNAEGGFGEVGQQARALLEERGVGERTITEARDIIAQIGTITAPPPGSTAPEAAALAEERLWNWYLEWSGIARVAIRDRRLLRSLLRTIKKANGEEEDVIVNDDDLDTEPPPPIRPTDTDPNAL